jgi:hypothetical protein
MRYRGFVFLTLLLSFVPWANGQDHSQFAGTWKMDPARSESAHGVVPVESLTLAITLTDTRMTMETTRREGGKAEAFHEKLALKLDGSATTQDKSNPGTFVTAKAHWEGENLVVETSRIINDATVTTRYVHTLSTNGNEMTIDKTLTVQHGYEGVAEARNTGHGTDVFVRADK